MVYVHGGGFTSVSPNRGETFAAALQQAGIAVALVGYRLSVPVDRNGHPTRDGVQHPAHAQYIAEAVRFLVEHASHPRVNLDPARRGIMEHSAGARLAGMLLTNPTFLDEVGLSTADWTAGLLIDSEAYRFDDTLPRDRPVLSPLTRSIYGISRRADAPGPAARPVGYIGGALYDVVETPQTRRSSPVLYPSLASGAGAPPVYDPPHRYNASPYYNITAGDPVAPLLLVYGTAPGRRAAAVQMRDAALAAGQPRARTLETTLNHGQINWYFGRSDLGPEARRYTESVIAWLQRRFAQA